MRSGEIVFDGAPEEFDDQRLSRLYQNADWGDGEPAQVPEDRLELEAAGGM
jgi:phosphonate transport system ATP-binding protein